jgi:hypothetical protein
MTRPGRLRYIANSVGPPLPENTLDRIRNDRTGSAATPGHLMRSMLAFLPVYAGVALRGGSCGHMSPFRALALQCLRAASEDS